MKTKNINKTKHHISRRTACLSLAPALGLFCCHDRSPASQALTVKKAKTPYPVPGAERLAQVNSELAGKKVGLIANQSSLVGQTHLIDALRDNGIAVRKLFAVEHGLRGTTGAGATVKNALDGPSGLPVISIYGHKKAPAARDLKGLDVLVFDLQDVGVRFFTYLSSLHLLMQSCAQNRMPLLVLDRPNPNGAWTDGPILEPAWRSFIGMDPIPLLHGMTLGELAKMINGEGWLGQGQACDLSVIPVRNYTRTMPYALPVRPSPNLPNAQAVALYPSLALFEATNISIGRGTDFPFQVLGGTRPEYGPFSFTPLPKPRASMQPKLNGQKLYGEDLRTSPVRGLHIEIFMRWQAKAKALNQPFLTRPGWLAKLMGTDQFAKQLEAGASARNIRASWQESLQAFKARRKPYLLYENE